MHVWNGILLQPSIRKTRTIVGLHTEIENKTPTVVQG